MFKVRKIHPFCLFNLTVIVRDITNIIIPYKNIVIAKMLVFFTLSYVEKSWLLFHRSYVDTNLFNKFILNRLHICLTRSNMSAKKRLPLPWISIFFPRTLLTKKLSLIIHNPDTYRTMPVRFFKMHLRTKFYFASRDILFVYYVEKFLLHKNKITYFE